ncbi:MAG: tRNA lysidine(34) synthetase TilS [Deltaproteobacteria bacterium]|nr:tRNA lysidine(34) synthetase TilS [Deltaproteobacteria bacterium]
MTPIPSLIARVRETILAHAMISAGDRVIAAVSGGPDSVCLLDVLVRLREDLRIELAAAHFDHGLRPSEDEEETAMVRNLAEALGVPLETGAAPSRLRAEASSLEERARDARYGFLEGVRKRLGGRRIALGHTLNDQAETVIMRLIRGSGPSGLAGIPPVRDGTIIRPLIEVRREDVMAYLEDADLPYAMDSSNLETRHLRNRIRMELIPLLQQYQPQIIPHLGNLSELMREQGALLEDLAGRWVGSDTEALPGGGIAASRTTLLALPRAMQRQVVREILMRVRKGLRRIDRDHILSVLGLLRGDRPQAELHLPDRIRIRRSYDRVVFSLGESSGTGDFQFLLEGPGAFDFKDVGFSLTLCERDNPGDVREDRSPRMALLDRDRIVYPLLVRNFRPGDRFVPLGMSGHKKVKDFFIDRRVPSEQRANLPILFCGDDLVWICGHRIDHRYRVTPATKNVLEVAWTPHTSP